MTWHCVDPEDRRHQETRLNTTVHHNSYVGLYHSLLSIIYIRLYQLVNFNQNDQQMPSEQSDAQDTCFIGPSGKICPDLHLRVNDSAEFEMAWCPHSPHLLPEEHCSPGWHLLFGSIAQLRCSAAER